MHSHVFSSAVVIVSTYRVPRYPIKNVTCMAVMHTLSTVVFWPETIFWTKYITYIYYIY